MFRKVALFTKKTTQRQKKYNNFTYLEDQGICICMIALNVKSVMGHAALQQKKHGFGLVTFGLVFPRFPRSPATSHCHHPNVAIFRVFFATIYRTQSFSNLCLKLLGNAHFAIFAPIMSPDSTRCDALHLGLKTGSDFSHKFFEPFMKCAGGVCMQFSSEGN